MEFLNIKVFTISVDKLKNRFYLADLPWLGSNFLFLGQRPKFFIIAVYKTWAGIDKWVKNAISIPK